MRERGWHVQERQLKEWMLLRMLQLLHFYCLPYPTEPHLDGSPPPLE